ncbi:hypothetical protein JTB14_010115 [Gonioctena quinquepunctata]|nr:hypothetical protein JTB14_010115 [Gonioctena quinquepunctata]
MRMLGGFVCLLYVLNVVFAEDIATDEGVLILTKGNFKSAVSDNEFILVEFYAPWCGHCKALAPEFAKAAKQLADQSSPIKLGKVDATEEQDLAEQFGIRGYPTLKFFRNGSPSEYAGGRQADDIVSWLMKKTGPPAKDLASVDAAKELIESNNVVIVGFFKDQSSEAAKAFLNVAAAIDDIPFGISAEDAVSSEYEAAADSIVLFKKFDEGKVVFEGEAKEEDIKKFVQVNSLPLLVEFNHDTAQKIFGGEIKSHLLLFLSKSDESFEKITEAASSVAKPFKDEVLFVTIDADEEDHQRILEFFGMQKKEIPAARLIRLEEDMAKYKPPTDELTAEAIQSFVRDFLDGKLSQHLLSQDLPEDWDKEAVKVLVASNFEEIALDAKKDVLVEFYAPWCGHCKQLVPIYDKVGEHFKDNENVVIAKMDATINELRNLKITSFPTLKLYKKEDNQVVEYNGPRTFEGLTKFVESGEDADAAPEEEVAEDDDAAKKDEL